MLFENKSNSLIRLSAISTQDNVEDILESSVGDILSYLSRRSDVETIRDAMRARFAVGIEKTEAGYETYSKGMVSAGIDQGLYEAISSGIGNKIINSLANLFTMKNQSYQYVSESGEPVEGIGEMIAEQRAVGAYDTEMICADRISCAVETCPVLVQLNGQNLSYKSFSPACIYPVFSHSIMDNGIIRATNQLDIEDASYVVIKLSSVDDFVQNNGTYLAIFGRSEDFPNGRYVQFKSQNWRNIPKVGDSNAIDYLIDDEPANPLSWLAARGRSSIEYPIVLISGGQALTKDKLISINSSLYDSSVEIDLGYSRVLKDSLSASTGTKIVKNPDGSPLPKTLEGSIVLNGLQEVEFMAQSASNCTSALDVLGTISKSVAEGFSVPSYMVLSDGAVESGVALMIRTKPLLEHREYRVKLNTAQVNKIFDIEKSLIELVSGKAIDAKQIWNAGNYVVPETESEKVTALKSAVDAKLISYVKAVRAYHNLASDQEAMDLIDQMRMQNEEYGITVKEPAAPVVVAPIAPMAPETDEEETIEESNG